MSLIKKLSSAPRFICRRTMNERGFFTIAGFCLLLALTLCLQGVQEFEGNYSYGVSNFQIEHKLQNAADSGIYEAVEQISDYKSYRKGESFPISVNLPPNFYRLKNFKIEVAGRRDSLDDKSCTVLISVASCDIELLPGKIYRRAFAYIFDDGKTVHFMKGL